MPRFVLPLVFAVFLNLPATHSIAATYYNDGQAYSNYDDAERARREDSRDHDDEARARQTENQRRMEEERQRSSPWGNSYGTPNDNPYNQNSNSLEW